MFEFRPQVECYEGELTVPFTEVSYGNLKKRVSEPLLSTKLEHYFVTGSPVKVNFNGKIVSFNIDEFDLENIAEYAEIMIAVHSQELYSFVWKKCIERLTDKDVYVRASIKYDDLKRVLEKAGIGYVSLFEDTTHPFHYVIKFDSLNLDTLRKLRDSLADFLMNSDFFRDIGISMAYSNEIPTPGAFGNIISSLFYEYEVLKTLLPDIDYNNYRRLVNDFVMRYSNEIATLEGESIKLSDKTGLFGKIYEIVDEELGYELLILVENLGDDPGESYVLFKYPGVYMNSDGSYTELITKENIYDLIIGADSFVYSRTWSRVLIETLGLPARIDHYLGIYDELKKKLRC